MVEWIATYALWLWALLLILAVLTGNLAWHRNARLRREAIAAGRQPELLQARTGVILLLAMVLLFGAIAFGIGAQQSGPLAHFDMALAADLHALLPLSALRVIAVVTHLGDPLAVTAAAMLVVAILLLRRQRELAASWTLALIGIMPINSGIKAIFQRPRPLHGHGFITEPGWSFPSGHATGAVVFYGMLAYVLLRLLPLRWHRAIILTAVTLIGVIGISRIMLQVHYFSDVMAGYTCGLAWLVLCIGFAEWLHARSRFGATHALPGSGQPVRRSLLDESSQR